MSLGKAGRNSPACPSTKTGRFVPRFLRSQVLASLRDLNDRIGDHSPLLSWLSKAKKLLFGLGCRSTITSLVMIRSLLLGASAGKRQCWTLAFRIANTVSRSLGDRSDRTGSLARIQSGETDPCSPHGETCRHGVPTRLSACMSRQYCLRLQLFHRGLDP